MIRSKQKMCAVTRSFVQTMCGSTRVVGVVGHLVVLILICAAASAQSNLAWQKLTPLGTLSPRAYFATAYDPVSQNVVIFGGYNNNGQLDETWIYDGQNWRHAVEYVHPSARASASMVYDAKLKKIVLFGGYDGQNYLNDTWIFDGATRTWTQAFPTNVPPGVAGPMLFADPVSGRADMYGGFDGRLYQYATWRWNSGNWHRVWTPNSGTARGWAVAATNPVNHQTVMFGGIADVRPDTWTFDGKDWTEQSFSGEPQYFPCTAGYFDPQLGEVVVLFSNQTWAWDGTAWSQLTTLSAPIGREGAGTVWDAKSGQFLVFAGSSSFGLMSDTWMLTQQ